MLALPRVGQDHIYIDMIYILHIWQGSHQTFGHIRCICFCYIYLHNFGYI
jgi:hypothetical protein